MKLKTETAPESGFEKLDAADGDEAFCDKSERRMMVQGMGATKAFRINKAGKLVEEDADPRYNNDVGGFLKRNNVQDRGANENEEY